jgi:hypothetical protein
MAAAARKHEVEMRGHPSAESAAAEKMAEHCGSIMKDADKLSADAESAATFHQHAREGTRGEVGRQRRRGERTDVARQMLFDRSSRREMRPPGDRMNHRIAFTLLLFAFAAPVTAADTMFLNYWDRYATKLTTERVPADSPTTSFYRSQFAVMAINPAFGGSTRSTTDTREETVAGEKPAPQQVEEPAAAAGRERGRK